MTTVRYAQCTMHGSNNGARVRAGNEPGRAPHKKRPYSGPTPARRYSPAAMKIARPSPARTGCSALDSGNQYTWKRIQMICPAPITCAKRKPWRYRRAMLKLASRLPIPNTPPRMIPGQKRSEKGVRSNKYNGALITAPSGCRTSIAPLIRAEMPSAN